MPPTSDEDLQKVQAEVQKLRDQVAAEERKAADRARGLDNDIAAADLAAEKMRLETRLAAAKESGKASAVKAGASAPLAAAKQQMELAIAQAKAAEELRTADAAVASGDGPSPTDTVITTTEGAVAHQATTKGAPDVKLEA